MPQQDYILRMIEQMGRMLIELRRILLGGGHVGPREVEDRLRRAMGTASLDLDVARAASDETLAMMVAPTGEVEPGRCWLAAETLFVDGIQAQLEDRPDDARDRFEKARRLFGLLEPGSPIMGLPEAGQRLRELDERLATLENGGE